MRSFAALCLLLMLLVVPRVGPALGGDHHKPAHRGSSWPEGLAELVNSDLRVHGFYVNWTDTFFFDGTTEQLGNFLIACFELPGTEVSVVLHTGRPEVKSPWDDEPRAAKAEWTIHSSPLKIMQADDGTMEIQKDAFNIRVDVWTGGRIDLDQLLVPVSIPVSAVETEADQTTDHAIEAFLRQHHERQAKAEVEGRE